MSSYKAINNSLLDTYTEYFSTLCNDLIILYIGFYTPKNGRQKSLNFIQNIAIPIQLGITVFSINIYLVLSYLF